MGLEIISRAIQLSLLLSLAGLFVLNFALSFSEGLGFFLGGLWGCTNLLFIKHLVQNVVKPHKDGFKILALLAIKFPLLYAAGYFILSSSYFSMESVAIGSTIIFITLPVLALIKSLSKKTALLLLPLCYTPFLGAQIDAADKAIPELPNFITLIYKSFQDTFWAPFLHHWESLIFSILIAVLLSTIFYLGTKKKEMLPTGLQNFLEWFAENLRWFVVDVIGPEGEKYVPFLGTLFVYILTMNWFVLIPFMKSPSSNINITIALAICVFVLVQYLNIKNYGIKGFMFHMAGSPKDAIGWMMVPLMFPIELLTQFTRPITLALRLFGNVFGEDILIGAFALFGVAMLSHLAQPLGVPLQIPFMFLALLTGLMQALVFTLLSTIYILLSIPSTDHVSA